MIETLRDIFLQYTPGSSRSLLRSYRWLDQTGVDDVTAWESMSSCIHAATQDNGSYPIRILPRVYTSWTTRPYQDGDYKEGWCLNWSRECCVNGVMIVRQQRVSVGKQSCLLAVGVHFLTGESTVKPLVISSYEELLDIYDKATLLAIPYALRGRVIERLLSRRLNRGRPVRYGFDPTLEFLFLRQRRVPVAEALLSVSAGSSISCRSVPSRLNPRRPVKELHRLLAG